MRPGSQVYQQDTEVTAEGLTVSKPTVSGGPPLTGPQSEHGTAMYIMAITRLTEVTAIKRAAQTSGV